MTVTSKGLRWEILHSLWIGWTFTLGFFNWIAFFYIGFRTRQRKWILWGLLYSVPFVVMMFIVDTENRDSVLSTLTVALQLILAVASPIHAFWIRKEYLMRLEALQSRAPDRTATLKRQVEREYGTEAQETAPGRSSSAQPSQSAAPPARNRGSSSASLAHSPDSPSSTESQTSAINLNNASEKELAALPGGGIIIAKRAVSLRESRGDFRSIEEFGETLNLKPHVVERIRPLVSVSSSQRLQQSDSSGRVVDF